MEAKRYDCSHDDRIESMKYYLMFRGYGDLIGRIFDRKGELEVYWKDRPSNQQMEEVAKIWLDSYNENATSHYIIQEVELRTIYY